MKQTKKTPQLAPYGSVAFLSVAAKVGDAKVGAKVKNVSQEARKVVRRRTGA